MNISENIKQIVSVDVRCGYKCKTFRKRDIECFSYLTKKGFRELKKDAENEPTVVGDVYIRRKRYEEIDNDNAPYSTEIKKEAKGVIGIVTVPYSSEYQIDHPDETEKKYDLFKAKLFRRSIGYAELKNKQYVRLVAKTPIVPLLFLLFFILLLSLGRCTNPAISNPTPIDETTTTTVEETTDLKEEIEIDPHLNDWNGEFPNANSTAAAQEEIEVIGYDKTELTRDNPYINLINPKGNTVYFKYTILVDGKTIYSTKALPPNTYIKWNAFECLNNAGYSSRSGEISLKMYIETFDISTLAPCNPATVLTLVSLK